MLVQHKSVGGKGLFYIADDAGEIQAEMSYTKPADNKMIIDHTEVSPELGGKGVGLQLLHAAVDYARTYHLSIIPLCPFAKSVFDKKPELRDVLA